MPLSVAYHDPSTTSRVAQSVLGWPCEGLRSLTDGRPLAANKSRDNLVQLGLQTLHRGATSGTY